MPDSGSYHSDRARQKRAQEAIQSVVEGFRGVLTDFGDGYEPISDWMGWTDGFARQMQAQKFDRSVTDTLKPLVEAVEGAWFQAVEVGKQTELPVHDAVDDIVRTGLEQEQWLSGTGFGNDSDTRKN
ncbi:hypothetical protein ABTZ58_23915 [Streptomyces sp. NPDC094143]|uniref:hypothetical protein n=1 Tax=Streptomyces sp. NPDC094143 TaxID=3155310 RepID=UPI0033300FFE